MDLWERRRSAWRRGEEAHVGPRRRLAAGRDAGAAMCDAASSSAWRFLSAEALRALSATSRSGLVAARRCASKLRDDLTRGCSSRRVRVAGLGPSGEWPGDSFSYAARLVLPRAYASLTTTEDDVLVNGLYVRWVARFNGFGLFSSEPLGASLPALNYTGELIGRAAAQNRERSKPWTFVLSVVEHSIDDSVPAWRTTVDASERGGAARFLNHSCSPNLRLVARRTVKGQLIPTLTLLTRFPVAVDEELTFDYSGITLDNPLEEEEPISNDDVVGHSRTPCMCESANCRKWLPRHRDWAHHEPDL